ncbi:MAG TPA: HEAT repeat domain-containing protein, partial [Gemmatimonadales bacterium]|nr:HEAT repeat domain-containing protein [Gemmatimonadales bacterium]
MEAEPTFIKRFGDLVALLRADPGNDAAQDLALATSAAAVETEPVVLEAGIAWSVIPDDLTLKGRLLARHIETIRIAAGTGPEELLTLARALSHDAVPVQSSPNIQVEMVQFLTPPPAPSTPTPATPAPAPRTQLNRATERRSWTDRRRPGGVRHLGIERRQAPDRRVTGERRVEIIRDQQAESARLHETLVRSVRSLTWDAALTAALALVRLVPKVPAAERRTFGIHLRRAIPRRAIESLVGLGEREAEQRPRAAEVLRWIGLDAAEVVLDRLLEGEALGVRGFYYDVLGGMPGVYPLVTPLLASRRPLSVRHGAALLGRLGLPAGIDELLPLLTHRDEGVRVAAVRAIGEIHEGSAADALRQALHHPDARTRAAAADAIGVWRGGVLAILIVATLETERDRGAWQSMVSVLGRLATIEACSALAHVALTRRSMVRRTGYSTTQRLAAVEALGMTHAPTARGTLERLARDAEGVVRYAA